MDVDLSSYLESIPTLGSTNIDVGKKTRVSFGKYLRLCHLRTYGSLDS